MFLTQWCQHVPIFNQTEKSFYLILNYMRNMPSKECGTVALNMFDANHIHLSIRAGWYTGS